MNLKLRYVPPIKTSFLVLTLIGYFPTLLSLFLAFNQFGIIVVLLFTLFYAFFMVLIFFLLSQRFFLEMREEDNILFIRKGFKKKEVDINQIGRIELEEKKRSFILRLKTKEKTKTFALSGSLSFEEPPFVPLLRKMQELRPVISMNEYCQGILHGDSTFNPWSSKMYFAYWTYISVMIGFYLFLLVGLLILR